MYDHLHHHYPGWIPSRAGEKVASALGIGGGFRPVLWFPSPLTTGYSRLSRNTAENVTKKKSKFRWFVFWNNGRVCTAAKLNLGEPWALTIVLFRGNMAIVIAAFMLACSGVLKDKHRYPTLNNHEHLLKAVFYYRTILFNTRCTSPFDNIKYAENASLVLLYLRCLVILCL